jgi:Ca2+-binding EF-hand superfamily protein
MSERSPTDAYVEQWFDSWRNASALGWECLETLCGLRPPQRLRSRLLAEARQTTAEYLRSPAFLELMRVNLSAMTIPSRLIQPFRIH